MINRKEDDTVKFPCPCCGNLTLPSPAKEAIAFICPVCFWENDVFSKTEEEPSDENGGLTLREGRLNYKRLGVCQKDHLQHVRKPLPEEKRYLMQAVIFMGLQACGKSTYYKQNFVDSHIRINLDMLRTRNREQILFQACLQAKQNFVIDNTNPCKSDRERYIVPAKVSGFQIVGYFFSSTAEEAIERNRNRVGNIPDTAILNTQGKMEVPVYEEGFDELFQVKIVNGDFVTIPIV